MESYPLSKLIIEQGPTPGQEIELAKDETVIGRIADNDLVIPDPSISRRHARLLRQGGQTVLEDLGSSNGTYLNGQRLSAPTLLRSGDTFTLGPAIRLRYQAPLPIARPASAQVGSQPVGFASQPTRPWQFQAKGSPGQPLHNQTRPPDRSNRRRKSISRSAARRRKPMRYRASA